jgi:hypothetical protein
MIGKNKGMRDAKRPFGKSLLGKLKLDEHPAPIFRTPDQGRASLRTLLSSPACRATFVMIEKS